VPDWGSLRPALACLTAALLGAGCGAGPAARSHHPDDHADHDHAAPPLGAWQDLPIWPLEAPGAADPAGALHAARGAAGEAARETWASLRQEEAGGQEETTDPWDPWTAAWTRVERASVAGWVAALPSPPPRPVSVERQQLAASRREVPPGMLRLHVANARESWDIQVYDLQGRMRPQAIVEASRALRDVRSGRTRTVHPRTLAMLYLIGQHYDTRVTVISGYRVRGVNATEGSRHGSGEAVDIRIPNVGPREVARHIDSTFLQVGVGYYPTSQFVHIDRRDRSYYWTDRSGPGQRSRLRTRSPFGTPAPGSDPTLRSIHLTEEEVYQPPPDWQHYGY
jgi:uncharacterized protein YcbK (DUF882 family)